MPTDRIHELPAEAERIRQEATRLLEELNGRRPSGALLIRAKNLRRQWKALASTIDRLQCHEMAVALAFKERTSRNIEEGDTITAQDTSVRL